MSLLALAGFVATAVLLSLRLANSYILLTANLDDVHSLAKQIVDSPVVNQINDIIRQATSTFNDQNPPLPVVRKHNPENIHKRTNPELDEDRQKREDRKHNPEPINKQFIPELDEDRQKREDRKHNPEPINKQFNPELDEDRQKREERKHKLESIHKQSNPEFDEDRQKSEDRKHNPEHVQKRSSPELFENPQKPVVRKHNPEHIQKQSNPELDEEPQINSRQASKENTEKNLPQPTEEEKLKKDAAPENDNDDIEVWTPDKKALMSELNTQNSDSSSEDSEENNIKPSMSRRIQNNAEIAELGRNASFYLSSIKKIFENV